MTCQENISVFVTVPINFYIIIFCLKIAFTLISELPAFAKHHAFDHFAKCKRNETFITFKQETK